MSTHKSGRFHWRRLVNDIHLWMGIGSGLILFVVCLSGTLYAFRAEVERLLEPDKYRVEVAENAGRMSTEDLFAQISRQTGGMITSVSIPSAPNEAYKVRIKKNEEERRGSTYYVNPYTAEIIGGSDGPASAFFSTVFRLHRWLLMERATGRIIVGTATVIFVFIIISGYLLWIPRKLKLLRQSLTIKTTGNWKRVNYDLHNSLGFYAGIFLLVMALSGLCWSFEWYRDALGGVLGTKVFGSRGQAEVVSKVDENAFPLSVEEVLLKSNEQLPYPGDYVVYLPDTADAPVTVRKYRSASFAGLTAYDLLKLDQYSGEVLHQDIYAERPLNEKISTMIKPIHTGEIFGTFSKIIYFMASLIGTSLPVTGVMIWVNKLKKKRRKSRKPSMAS
jgi:uncharacterized iron-regulated membrane protein